MIRSTSLDFSSKKISPERREMIVEYLEQAAILAGYSRSSARAITHDILKKERQLDEIEEIYKLVYDALPQRARRVLEELAGLCFSDIRDCFDSNGRLLDINEMPDSIAKAISGIKVKRHKDTNGNETGSETVEIRLWDKTKALPLLGKHFGILKDSMELTGPGGGPVQIETSTLDIDALDPKTRELLLNEIKTKLIGSGQTERVDKEEEEEN